MKHLCAVTMMGMLVILCVLLITESRDVTGTYNDCIQQAKIQEEKGLYLNAISKYTEALEIYDEDPSIKYQIVCDYKNMGDMNSWITAAELFVENFPENTEDETLIKMYDEIVEFYYENKDYEKLIPLLNELKRKSFVCDADELQKKINKYYLEIRSIYTVISCDAEYISDFYQNLALKKTKGGAEQYLITTSGDNYNTIPYEEILILDAQNGYSMVKEKGQYKVYTSNGYLKDIDDNKLEEVRFYNSNYIAGKKSGVFHMYTSAFKNADFGEWDDFHLIAPGIACVDVEGICRMLIGNSTLEIEGNAWKSIIFNERGIRENNVNFFVGKEGNYSLITVDAENMNYETVLENIEDAQAFNTEEPAAVKQNGTWGFVSTDGTMVIETQYEEAKSFAYGYAPVKINGKWTLIDSEGIQVMEPQFQDMGTPTEDGIIPVKFDSGRWDLISLFIKNYN